MVLGAHCLDESRRDELVLRVHPPVTTRVGIPSSIFVRTP